MSSFNSPLTANTFTNAKLASHWLQQGNLLAYPTESVWGIGCDAYNEQAVQQLLAIKQRSIDKGLIVITDDVNRVTEFLNPLPSSQRQQILASWLTATTLNPINENPDNPNNHNNHSNHKNEQATTWLLPIPKGVTRSIPAWITGKHDSLAVRVINHPLIKTLCTNMISVTNPYGFIVSTSCNPSGKNPATSFANAFAYFGDNKQVKYLQGQTLGYTKPSLIKDAITGKIIR